VCVCTRVKERERERLCVHAGGRACVQACGGGGIECVGGERGCVYERERERALACVYMCHREGGISKSTCV
jgi:hypothetical protein